VALGLYRILLYVISPVFFLRFLWRTWRSPDYAKRVGERIGFASLSPSPNRIWIHAVSVGEVNAAVPLVNAIYERWPDKSVVITTMTVTGTDRVKQVFDKRVTHQYLPYDFPGAVARFLQRMTPELGIVMETELWPNLIQGCHTRGVPLIYANVRLSERSFKGYWRVRWLFSPLLTKVRRFAVQAEADAQRLIKLGAPKDAVEITGSLKFDMNMPASVIEAGQSIRRQIGDNRQVIVAASTHEGEELALLEVYQRLKMSIDGLLLVLVPRHPERFDSVYRLCNKNSVTVIRRSQDSGSVAAETEVIVVDLMGLLPQYLYASDVTFMGGSLVPTGGHNLLEPAALGRVVVFGPHMFNFSEIARLFVELEAGVQVNEASELDNVIVKLLDDPELRNRFAGAGEQLIKNNRGALNKVIELVSASVS